MSFGACRWQQEVDRHLEAASRLKDDEPAQAVINLIDVVHLVEHGVTGNSHDPSGDHLADLAFAVHINKLQCLFPAHD
jgi:hypothetical protein